MKGWIKSLLRKWGWIREEDGVSWRRILFRDGKGVRG